MNNDTNRHGSENRGRLAAVEVSNLTKKYGDRTILNRLNLELPGASLVGLLGPNGAGKTTLIKLLAGLLSPDEGMIRLAGCHLKEQEAQARGHMAYVPDVPSLYPELTVIEHLELTARAHNTLATFDTDARLILERFGLWEARNGPTYTLSRGMAQKLAICCAFIRPSSVMLMDEPGGSLDIGSLSELYGLLREYRQAGGTALLSSHQWDTLQNLCDNFVLLRPGQIVAGNLQSLRRVTRAGGDTSLREIYLAFMTMTDKKRIPAEQNGNNISAYVSPEKE